MDYLIDGIIIVFLLSVIIYLFNAAKGISSSKNFPTPKDDSEKKENDKWTIIDKSKTSKAVLLVALNKGGIVSKYFIAVVLLLGLMQGKTEALEKDIFIVLKEFGVITIKYKTYSDTKEDTKRLACFDTLTQYMGERKKVGEPC